MRDTDDDAQAWELGDMVLSGGETLRDARLVYQTHGVLNSAGDNCILLPTYYAGTHRSYAPLIGAGKALDPARYFIVVVNMFGNGLSTSPSNAAASQAGRHFPKASIHDNVACQHRLLTEVLGVRSIALVTGWSMGAMQAYHWAARFPAMVERLLAVCGSARCWPLNAVFLEGIAATLAADRDGLRATVPEGALRAFGRVYAGWAYSAQFFRDALYRDMGFDALETFLRSWEDDHLAWNAHDLLAMLHTWQSAAGDGDDVFGTALGRIRAQTVIMPCDTDAYFTMEEAHLECAEIPQAALQPIKSPYGHCAGAPGRFAKESAQIEKAMRALLSSCA